MNVSFAKSANGPVCNAKVSTSCASQFDVVSGTSAGGGGFYVDHTMWAVLVEVPFSLVELPYTPPLFLLSSFSAQPLGVSSVQSMKGRAPFFAAPPEPVAAKQGTYAFLSV
ncbi:hypothetical protein [Alteribacillus iranensis]|uniref:hypothetical protein n=1 Tax=Alteribacillus iranensis TaxID=930128 RepID=UPI001160D267|nr:hypothetical protein [Alteribacillus iranensis]